MTIASKILPGSPSSTGIGSLPHHNVDAALEFCFQTSIPFLPQIPIRNAWEFMIPQALEGMPGLLVEPGGAAVLDLDVWTGRSRALNERLSHAFEGNAEALASFEPTAATASCWQPFLWELEERGAQVAKIQIAGPLTAGWSLRLKDGTAPEKHPEISNQIFKLVLARALAMSQRLKSAGIEPILYIDEPGFYGFSKTNPRHVMGLQELKLMIQALKKQGVTTGLHCCSNTEWVSVLGLGLDILSIDTGLSLAQLLKHEKELTQFIEGGARLSLGVIPTHKPGGATGHGIEPLSPQTIFTDLMDTFSQHWKDKPAMVRKILQNAIYTPACGLALHTPGDAETILHSLLDFQTDCTSRLMTT